MATTASAAAAANVDSLVQMARTPSEQQDAYDYISRVRRMQEVEDACRRQQPSFDCDRILKPAWDDIHNNAPEWIRQRAQQKTGAWSYAGNNWLLGGVIVIGLFGVFAYVWNKQCSKKAE